MENKKPQFAIVDRSVIAIATELHNHFRDMQSYYKIAHGEILSQLEACTDEAQSRVLSEKMQEINEKITFFHVLNNAISTVDTILHTDKMIEEFKLD
jgi:hypothetical protein